MPRTLFNLFPHLIVAFDIQYVGNKFQSILVVLNLRLQTSEVESVREVVFIDLAKVFVAACCYKLFTTIVSTPLFNYVSDIS
jgi:hypothetical protein